RMQIRDPGVHFHAFHHRTELINQPDQPQRLPRAFLQQPANGLRLNGERRRVRCSRGLGHGAKAMFSLLAGRIPRAYRSRTTRILLRPQLPMLDTNARLEPTRTLLKWREGW